LPHADYPSNRDRFVVELDKSGKLMWANCTGNNIVAAEKRLPEHHPRLGQHQPKAKAVKTPKPEAKVKAKAAKPKAERSRSQSSFSSSNVKGVAPPSTVTFAKNAPACVKVETKLSEKRKGGGRTPKVTWYGLVDGEVVSVRKVLCPEGFKANKFEILIAPPTPEVHIPDSSFKPALPAAETPAALPQATVA
jgi:hypothetical protein